MMSKKSENISNKTGIKSKHPLSLVSVAKAIFVTQFFGNY